MKVRRFVLAGSGVLVLVVLFVAVLRVREAGVATPETGRSGGTDGIATVRIPSESRGSSNALQDALAGASRAEVLSAALSGRIEGESGDPILGARVTWTLLGTRESTARLTTISGAKGRFEFFDRPPGSDDERSVLWASHPDFVARPSLVEAGVSSAGHQIVVLSPSSRSIVHVSREGKAIVDALITQVFVGEATPWEPGVADAFRNEVPTDAMGEAVLHPVPATQRVSARSEDGVSSPWFGVHGERIELRVGSTFRAGGVVAGAVGPGLSSCSIRCEAYDGMRGVNLGSVACGEDGRWLLEELPLPDSGSLRFVLQGPEVAVDEAVLPVPPPGTELTVPLRAIRGETVWAQAADAETEEILLDAEVVVQWQDDGRIVRRMARARDDGYIAATGCRPGEVSLEFRAPGYQPEFTEGFRIPEPEPQTSLVLLKKGGQVRGRVTHEGGPVPDYELFLWRSATTPPHVQPVVGAVDGRFELDNAPTGVVSIQAVAPQGAPSAAVQVEVVPSRTATVDLALRTSVKAVGRVVDADTGLPVMDAIVWPTVTREAMSSVRRSIGCPVGWDGRFEVAGLAPGFARIEVEAPGYAVEVIPLTTTRGVSAEVGLVKLERKRPFEVALETSPALAPSDCWVEVLMGHVELQEAFDAQGVARFDADAPEQVHLLVGFPDGSRGLAGADLSGEPGRVVLVADGTSAVTVKVTGTSGYELAPHSIETAHLLPSGLSMVRSADLDGENRATLDYLRAGPYYVKVSGQGGVHLATARVDLAEGERAEIEIRIGEGERRVRIEGADGTPASGARLEVYESGDSTAIVSQIADPNGEVALFGELPRDVDARVTHERFGRHLAMPVRLPEDEDELVRIVLDEPVDYEFVLTGWDDAPAVGLVTQLEDGTLRYAWRGLPTDERGSVRYEGVGRGAKHIQIDGEDYWSLSFPLELAGDRTRIELRVSRLATVLVRSSSPEGAPVANVPFELFREDYGFGMSRFLEAGQFSSSTGAMQTGPAGTVELVGVPEGPYTWRIGLGDGPPDGSALLEPGDGNELELVVR